MAGKPLYKFKDVNYFKNIDTEEKAYFLGLIFADGSLNDKLSTMSISLVDDDSYILEVLIKNIYSDRSLRIIKPKKVQHKVQKQLTITGKDIYNNLLNHGLSQNKSVTGNWVNIKNIPNVLQNHFIRGYFDGDGCIYINPKNKNKFVTFTGHTDFIKLLRDFLKENIELNTGNISNRNKECLYNSTLAFGGNKQVDKIKEYLYKNSTIYLERKREKFYR